MRTALLRGLRLGALLVPAMLVLACGHETPPPQQPVTTTSAYQNRSDSLGPSVADLSDPATRRSMSDAPSSPNPLDGPSLSGAGVSPIAGDLTGAQPMATPTIAPENLSADVLTKSDPALTPGQVVAVLIGANQGEIQMAELAMRKATSDDTKQFAAMMKNHHTTGLQKAKTAESKAKVTRAPSDVSAYLDNEVSGVLKSLHEKSGAAFDRAYMDSQVKAHKDVLAVIDHRLLPSASNGEIRALVSETRQVVVSHLTQAQSIDGKLQPAATTMFTPSATRSSASLSRSSTKTNETTEPARATAATPGMP